MTSAGAAAASPPSRGARRPGLAVGRLLRLELRRSTMLWMLPLLAVLLAVTELRNDLSHPPLWVVRSTVVQYQLELIGAVVAGVAAWTAGRDGRRHLTDLVRRRPGRGGPVSWPPGRRSPPGRCCCTRRPWPWFSSRPHGRPPGAARSGGCPASEPPPSWRSAPPGSRSGPSCLAGSPPRWWPRQTAARPWRGAVRCGGVRRWHGGHHGARSPRLRPRVTLRAYE